MNKYINFINNNIYKNIIINKYITYGEFIIYRKIRISQKKGR